ncbi:MAG: hypothetical protein AAGI11_15235 [Pseudomonadota bacterium]
MTAQDWINVAIAVFGLFGGIVFKNIFDSLEELRKSGKELSDKVHSIDTLVAGEYVKRAELRTDFDKVFSKLDEIDSKIDSKADKS